MAEQSGIQEAVNVGSTASSFINAAKGIAGGPIGAVIGTVIQNRDTIKKAIVGITAFLMLPVIFIVMLPGLVFGSFSDNSGVLNDSSLMAENIRAANEAITEILIESHDEVRVKVESLASRIPEGDTAQITDPYEYSIYVNATLLISQFCASKDNYEEINITELKKVIRENKDGLFSYDASTETLTTDVPVEDGEEGETKTISFTQHNYVIKYAGDSYFADCCSGSKLLFWNF